jgi:hypothetical protein
MYGSDLSIPVTALASPRRNRYFFGKMLDVYHFELETTYGNAKRWLINRLVLGYGVVCGLNLRPAKDPYSVILHPGVALDKWGREIIVPQETALIIPEHLRKGEDAPAAEQQQQQQAPHEEHHKCWVHMRLCYHECLADPVRVESGDCEGSSECVPGAIHERFRVEFRPGKARRPKPDPKLPGTCDYAALAHWVSSGCPKPVEAKHTCIALANIRLRPHPGNQCHSDDIDITVRPIVFSNDLLFSLICCDHHEPGKEHD